MRPLPRVRLGTAAGTLALVGVAAVAVAQPAPTDSLGVYPVPPAAAVPTGAPQAAGAAEGTASPGSMGALASALSELDRDEQALREEIAALGKRTEQADARVLVRGRRYLQMSRAGLLPLGGGFTALVDHASRVERLRRGLARDLADSRRSVEKHAKLMGQLEDMSALRRPLQMQRAELDRARAALLAEEDRALAFRRAFEQSTGTGHTAIYGSPFGPGDPEPVATGFGAMKGRLPFPIAGRAEIRSARRGGSGPGLEMSAPRGTPVRAVFAGRVGFADDYAEYGRTVIVDHGSGNFTVSANLAEVSVNVGDEVAVGARLGSVGDDGRGPRLYFEIRAGADVVDPAEWFGI